ncbi:MAG: hypothetical protein KME46_21145 [Brasilonema angustatum HA4187-MV1]|nr:hypothetical protein [Brasilonema angustatum HA4187-MV1]
MQIEFYSSVSYLPGYTKLQLTTVNRTILGTPGAPGATPELLLVLSQYWQRLILTSKS